jgi:hypothetical protein
MSSSEQTPALATLDPAAVGLVEALAWYDRQATGNRLAYQLLRLAAVVLAAAIPVLTTSGVPSLAVAILGSAVVVVEGIQQVFRFHDHYIAYRSTWNTLDREKRLFDSRAGRYAANPTPGQTLAERVDQILAEETTRWASDMTRAAPSSPTAP